MIRTQLEPPEFRTLTESFSNIPHNLGLRPPSPNQRIDPRPSSGGQRPIH
jgi:hypothetical protein